MKRDATSMDCFEENDDNVAFELDEVTQKKR